MQVIPFKTGPMTYNIFVMIEDDNLERMRAYDPAQLDLSKLPSQWAHLHLGTVIIGYGNAKDLERVIALLRAGDAASALGYLSRGFVFDPKRGDTDARYKSALKGDQP